MLYLCIFVPCSYCYNSIQIKMYIQLITSEYNKQLELDVILQLKSKVFQSNLCLWREFIFNHPSSYFVFLIPSKAIGDAICKEP